MVISPLAWVLELLSPTPTPSGTPAPVWFPDDWAFQSLLALFASITTFAATAFAVFLTLRHERARENHKSEVARLESKTAEIRRAAAELLTAVVYSSLLITEAESLEELGNAARLSASALLRASLSDATAGTSLADDSTISNLVSDLHVLRRLAETGNPLWGQQRDMLLQHLTQSTQKLRETIAAGVP